MWEPVDSVGDADGIGGGYPDLVASVVVKTGSKIETAGGVDGKRFSSFGAFVCEDFDARWSQGGLVEIEGAVDLSVG